VGGGCKWQAADASGGGQRQVAVSGVEWWSAVLEASGGHRSLVEANGGGGRKAVVDAKPNGGAAEASGGHQSRIVGGRGEWGAANASIGVANQLVGGRGSQMVGNSGKWWGWEAWWMQKLNGGGRGKW